MRDPLAPPGLGARTVPHDDLIAVFSHERQEAVEQGLPPVRHEIGMRLAVGEISGKAEHRIRLAEKGAVFAQDRIVIPHRQAPPDAVRSFACANVLINTSMSLALRWPCRASS